VQQDAHLNVHAEAPQRVAIDASDGELAVVRAQQVLARVRVAPGWSQHKVLHRLPRVESHRIPHGSASAVCSHRGRQSTAVMAMRGGTTVPTCPDELLFAGTRWRAPSMWRRPCCL
jgi:hypothetical protein